MTLFDWLLDFLLGMTGISLLLTAGAALLECIAACRGQLPGDDDDDEDDR